MRPGRLYIYIDIIGQIVGDTQEDILVAILGSQIGRVVQTEGLRHRRPIHIGAVVINAVIELIRRPAGSERNALQRAGRDQTAGRGAHIADRVAYNLFRQAVGGRIGGIVHNPDVGLIPIAVRRILNPAIGANLAADDVVPAAAREGVPAGQHNFPIPVIAVLGEASGHLAFETHVLLVEDEVHHAGQCIGPVCGRRAAGDGIDPRDELLRDRVDVNRAGEDAGHRAFSVEQDERARCAHPAQAQRANAGYAGIGPHVTRR